MNGPAAYTWLRENSEESRRADARSLFSRLVHMGSWLDGDDVVMFNRLFSYTGAVKMPAAPFFAAVETLLLFEVDDLRAASSDGLQGLLIDSLDGENALELWCWGEERLALVRETEEEKGTM